MDRLRLLVGKGVVVCGQTKRRRISIVTATKCVQMPDLWSRLHQKTDYRRSTNILRRLNECVKSTEFVVQKKSTCDEDGRTGEYRPEPP